MEQQQRPELLPANQTARYLRVPLKWLKEEAAAGRLPCLDAGGVFLFDPELVERVLLIRAREEIHAAASSSPPP